MKLFKKKEEEKPQVDAAATDSGEVDAEEILRKYDIESNTRVWEGIPKIVVTAFMVIFSVYCMCVTLLSTEQAEIRLARFLAFVIIIGFIVYPANKKKHKVNHIPWYDFVLMFAGAGSFLYFAFNCTDILLLGARIEPIHVVLGVIGILVTFELCRRCVGIPIIVVVGLLICYAFYYQLQFKPDFFLALTKNVQKLFYTTSGIIGTPTNVCYTYIVLFIIFGAFLERTGIANYFISFANRVAGWSSGGAAKVAVISSALCGMVSGSSVGNTVTTGSVTIPMMKKTGYKPEFAGAVEAASSTGGQIMPPIMGAAAFLMAEYMGIPYIEVCAKAILPALLYFTGIFCAVHLEAKKLGLKGMPKDQLPKWSYLAKNVYLIIPLVLLVWLVATGARTMAASAAISIAGAFLIGFINFFTTNLSEREEGETVGAVFIETCKIAILTAVDAFAAGAKNAISVAVACAMAGMIAGCITVTGLASTLINVIVLAAGDFIIVGLILTMVCCIILGMGVPTTANYCIMASTCAPILMALGLPQVAAHFFVFYFGIVADITPPVALAAYAGSAIAKSKPMKTAINASKIAIAAFIVPYVFAFYPSLILEGDVPTMFIFVNSVVAMIGLFGVAAGLNGYLFGKINPLFRAAVCVGGVMMMVPLTGFTEMTPLMLNGIGIAIVVVVVILQKVFGKKNVVGPSDSDDADKPEGDEPEASEPEALPDGSEQAAINAAVAASLEKTEAEAEAVTQ